MIESGTDPFREALLQAGDALPERMKSCAEPLRGEPAFDPEEIARKAAEIRLARTPGHPMLEKAVRIGLAHIDATFEGDHPKYGVGSYAKERHDGFPPTIIAAVDALTLWGFTERAEQLFSYWLRQFVRDDGSIAYYGPSLSEYGMLLTTARRLLERGGRREGLRDHYEALRGLATYPWGFFHREYTPALLKGVPEADEADQPATYFHNNAWVARGWEYFAFLLESAGLGNGEEITRFRRDAVRLREILLSAIEETWSSDPEERWLRPMVEPESDGYWERPQGTVTGNRLGSYTNYRYWPELLSSGVLPRKWAERIVEARLNFGGQYLGMIRFEDHLDDWPLMDYLEGLWSLGRVEDYRISLWGHVLYHQAEGHMTAYEQVSFPPGQAKADYCLPCQLVAVRAAPRLKSEV